MDPIPTNLPDIPGWALLVLLMVLAAIVVEMVRRTKWPG